MNYSCSGVMSEVMRQEEIENEQYEKYEKYEKNVHPSLPRPYMLRMTPERYTNVLSTVHFLVNEASKTSYSNAKKRRIIKTLFETFVKYPMFVYNNIKYCKCIQEMMVKFNNQGELWVRDYAKQMFGPNWEDLDMDMEEYIKEHEYCYRR